MTAVIYLVVLNTVFVLVGISHFVIWLEKPCHISEPHLEEKAGLKEITAPGSKGQEITGDERIEQLRNTPIHSNLEEKSKAISSVVETFSSQNRKSVADNYKKISRYVSELSPELSDPSAHNLHSARVIVESLFNVNVSLHDLGYSKKVLEGEGITAEQSYVESIQRAADRLEEIHANEYKRQQARTMELSLRELDAIAKPPFKSNLDI